MHLQQCCICPTDEDIELQWGCLFKAWALDQGQVTGRGPIVRQSWQSGQNVRLCARWKGKKPYLEGRNMGLVCVYLPLPADFVAADSNRHQAAGARGLVVVACSSTQQRGCRSMRCAQLLRTATESTGIFTCIFCQPAAEAFFCLALVVELP